MTPTDPAAGYRAAAAVVGRRAGLHLDPAQHARQRRCLERVAADRGGTVDDLVAQLDTDPAALQSLLDCLTVQETQFFRDPTQFDAFADHVLPTLADPVRLWSAGCSNGQEAYSMAMLLEERGRPGGVVATDISSRALARAAAGVYEARELRGLSPARRARHLVASGGRWRIADAVRSRVTVARQNLAEQPPPAQAGPVVFCRNVLIYFRPEVLLALLDRLHRWLPPDGWLFLGYSESLWHVTDNFQMQRLGQAFVYRPSGHGARPMRAPIAPIAPLPPLPPPAAAPVAVQPPDAPRAHPLEPAEYMAAGEAAAAAGDHRAAAAAFRRAAFLAPASPIASFHLGLALEASGDQEDARRAFAVARAALGSAVTADVEAALGGFRPDALAAWLDARLRSTA